MSFIVVLSFCLFLAQSTTSSEQTSTGIYPAEGRAKKTNFCPPGSQFSTFGFAAFVLITLQTVVNVVSASNSNNNNDNNNNNNDNNNNNNLNFNENDATM